jgi:glycerol-3-phosphate dehydrogenase
MRRAVARLRLRRTAGAARLQRRHQSSAIPSNGAAADARNGRVWRGAEAVAQLQLPQEQEQEPDPKARNPGDSAHRQYDVVVVGAGVVGSALAMELSQYQLSVLLVDANSDVGEGTSKANAAIVHTGFDATPSSLESELVTSASRDWPAMAARLQIPFRECGAVMLARDAEQAAMLPEIHAKAVANGTEDCVRILSAEEVREMEPHAAPSVQGGLLVAREAVADPFTTVVAYAEVAVANGVDLALSTRLVRVNSGSDGEGGGGTLLTLQSSGHSEKDSGDATVHATHLVNASGLGSRAVADLYGGAPFDINPRRGQFLVYDRQASSLLTRILLPLPTKQTKGMLVAPTIFGNVISGARKKKRRVVFPSCAIISFMKRAIICQDRLGTG